MDDGGPDIYGDSLGCDFGASALPLGIVDEAGFIKGWLLGWDDGCDVGQSETEG